MHASCVIAWRESIDADFYPASYGGGEFAALLPGVTETLAKSRGKDRVVAGASPYRHKERPVTTGDG